VLCRQTNAVWVAFVLGEAALDKIRLATRAQLAADPDARGASPPALVALALQRAWTGRAALLGALWPLLLPPLGFVAFLVANGGAVVVGDKAAHVPVRHAAQLLYFGGWAAALLWPQTLAQLPRLLAAAAKRPVAALAVGGAALAAAGLVARPGRAWATLVHPYILADNRCELGVPVGPACQLVCASWECRVASVPQRRLACNLTGRCPALTQGA
jgi:alpha-1,2-glucosyltransferase